MSDFDTSKTHTRRAYTRPQVQMSTVEVDPQGKAFSVPTETARDVFGPS